jgi:hypothetical protein
VKCLTVIPLFKNICCIVRRMVTLHQSTGSEVDLAWHASVKVPTVHHPNLQPNSCQQTTNTNIHFTHTDVHVCIQISKPGTVPLFHANRLIHDNVLQRTGPSRTCKYLSTNPPRLRSQLEQITKHKDSVMHISHGLLGSNMRVQNEGGPAASAKVGQAPRLAFSLTESPSIATEGAVARPKTPCFSRLFRFRTS